MKQAGTRSQNTRFWVLGALLLIALLVPIGIIAGRAVAALLAAHERVTLAIGVLLLVFVVFALLGLLRILFAYGRGVAARARAAEVLSMQNGHPYHVADVAKIASLIPRTLERYYDVEQTRAGVPQSLSHYHQEIAPGMSTITTIEPAAPAAPLQLTSATDLAGAIARGWSTPVQWYIGQDATGDAQRVELEHTGMIALSGIPGTGKTSTAAWLAAQTAAHGGVLFVADPHAGDKESLTNRLAGFSGAVERYATSADEINKLIMQVTRIYDRRCANPAEPQTPVLLLVDEFMQLMLRQQLSSDAERALVVLGGGGRKKGVYGALISQNWSAAAMGKRVTVLRQIVTGSLVHQSDEDTARFLLPKAYTASAATLPPGAAIWFGNGTPVRVSIPWLSEADVQLAARPHPVRPMRPVSQSSSQIASTSTQSTPSASSCAPTARAGAAPVAPAAPTVPLAPPTVQEQICALLDARPWLTSTEIAQLAGLDLKVVRTTLTPLERGRMIIRRETQKPVADRFEYAINQSIKSVA